MCVFLYQNVCYDLFDSVLVSIIVAVVDVDVVVEFTSLL